MSGYDFLSGFLGNLGDQMKDKEARKRALEDEARADQRAMSRQEALDASRERLQIAAEKRQQLRTEPSAYQEVRDGILVQGKRRFNPETQSYDEFGEATKVPQSDVGKAYDADGFRWQPQNYGGPRKVGRTEASLDRDASNSRSAASISAADRRAQLAAQNKPQGKVPGATAIDKAITEYRAANASGKAKIEAAYGVIPGSQPGSTSDAVEAAIRAEKSSIYDPNSPKYQSPASKQVSSELDGVVNAAKGLFGGGKPAPDIAAKIAEVKANDPTAKNATDAEIEAYLRAQGIIE